MLVEKQHCPLALYIVNKKRHLRTGRFEFDVPVGKDMMEREIIEQDKDQSDSLSGDGRNVAQMRQAKLDQKRENAATNRSDVKAETTCLPRACASRQVPEGNKVIGNKVCHD